jgi:hypothetical protein
VLSYTGELKQSTPSPSIPDKKTIAHKEISISDEGVGI